MRNYTEASNSYVNDYLASQSWKDLKEELLYTSPLPHCFICTTKRSLLLHHVSYRHLHFEELLVLYPFYSRGDVVPLCFDCHTSVHFYNLFGFWRVKVPLKRFLLIKSMLYRRLYFLLRNKRFIRAGVEFFLYLFSG